MESNGITLRLVIDLINDGGILHLLQVLLSSLGISRLLLSSSLYYFALHFQLHSAEFFAFFLLFFAQVPLLFVNLSCTGHVILGLGQEVLALSGFDGCASQVILHAVSVHCEVLEVFVGQTQLVHGLEEEGRESV